MLPLDLYARVRSLCVHVARETAGAARTRSSLRPLFAERVRGDARLGHLLPRECGPIFSVKKRAGRFRPAGKRCKTLSKLFFDRCANSIGRPILPVSQRSRSVALASTDHLRPWLVSTVVEWFSCSRTY